MKLPAPDESAEDLYEQAPCGYLSAAPDGTITRVNQTFLSLTGLTRTGLLAGRRVQDLMTVPGRIFYETHVGPLLRLQGFVSEIACDLERDDHNPLPVLMNCRVVRAADGQPLLMRFTFFDATVRRRFEHELQQARQKAEHFKAIVDTSADAILSMDPQGLVQSWNGAAERLFGVTSAEAIGRHVSKLIVPHDGALSIDGASAQLRRGTAVQGDTVCMRPDGQRVDVSITLSPHLEPPEELVGVSIIVRDMSGTSRAKARLIESERRLALGVRVAGLALAEIDYKNGTIDLSAQAAHLFGLGETAMSVPRDTVHGRFHADDRAEVMRRIAATLDPGSSGWFAMELRVVWPAGDVRWLRVRKQVFFEGDGGSRRATGALIAALDITSEKQAAEAVQASDERFRIIFDNAAVGMAHVGLDGKLMRVNPKMCDITGYTAQELAAKTFGEITHADDLERDLAQVARLRSGEINTYVTEKRYVRKDGTSVWVNLTVSPMRGASGDPLYFIAVIEDIAAKKAALEELDKQQRFVERLTQVVPSILYVFDIGAQRHVWINRQAGAALGHAQGSSGPSDQDFRLQGVHPDDRATVAALPAVLALLADGQTHETEYRLRDHDGRWRWFRSRETVFTRDAGGRVLEVIGVATDIDRSKRAEQALHDADRKKDTFIATLAHELRNPLAPIRNAVRTLKLKGPPDPQLVWCRDVIERQVGQMAHLLEDLLDVSRIAQGRVTLRREPLQVKTFIERAIEIARPSIDGRQHTLTVSVPSQPWMVDGDLTRLAQIFSNLLINAAKYTDPGGRIGLTVERQANEVVVEVSDTGIGIAADHLGRVFDVFSREESSRVSSPEGLGIGLSLVKGLVELHGGQVTASSPGLGQGSEFTVRLPLAVGVANVAASPLTSPLSGKPQGKPRLRVMVADDSRDITDSLEMVLSHDGFEVVVANDGEQALERAERCRPDVMLLDLGMPKVDGFDVARRIRMQPWGAGVTLIAQTGWGQASDRQRTQEAGFDHHVVKPVDPEVLSKMLSDLAERIGTSA